MLSRCAFESPLVSQLRICMNLSKILNFPEPRFSLPEKVSVMPSWWCVHKAWHTGGQWEITVLHWTITFQLSLTFTSYVVYCLFFLYNIWAPWEQIYLSDLYWWIPQCLEKCLIHLIYSCWMGEWSFQRNRWALSKLLGAFCLYFRKPDHRYAKEECQCP